MLFPTLQFIGFFALVLTLNGLAWDRAAWRKGLLIAASYVFYAAWDIRFTALMAFVSLTAWLGGLGVANLRAAPARQTREHADARRARGVQVATISSCST
ncbi:MAG: hypothetical protein R3D80_20530 [Paracoccaceae bacterium]